MRIYPALEDGKEAVTLVFEEGETLTSESINLLPFPIRKRIHDLETFDPSGYVQAIADLKTTVRALENRVLELEEQTRGHAR